MGSLPAPRVTPSRPFTHTGVDYAGPFRLKNEVGRVPKVYKGYLCLFICLATKAVHLEVATSLSTDAFIAAFRRFVSRRGLVSHMYSDNGTNFVGADKELQRFVKSAASNEVLSRELGEKGIQWHFIPPASPHMGGLWESAVKSSKHHIRRVTGGAPLTYEQFSTLVAQVEAVLNSRPLSVQSAESEGCATVNPRSFPNWCATKCSTRPSISGHSQESSVAVPEDPANATTFLETLEFRILKHSPAAQQMEMGE